MNANEVSPLTLAQLTLAHVNKAEERFQWACALAYAYDCATSDPDKAKEIRTAWGEYHRNYWVPVVANSYNRPKPEVPDYPGKVKP
jgi:hypothetical protein